jgi:hypothetical protein
MRRAQRRLIRSRGDEPGAVGDGHGPHRRAAVSALRAPAAAQGGAAAAAHETAAGAHEAPDVAHEGPITALVVNERAGPC